MKIAVSVTLSKGWKFHLIIFCNTQLDSIQNTMDLDTAFCV